MFKELDLLYPPWYVLHIQKGAFMSDKTKKDEFDMHVEGSEAARAVDQWGKDRNFQSDPKTTPEYGSVTGFDPNIPKPEPAVIARIMKAVEGDQPINYSELTESFAKDNPGALQFIKRMANSKMPDSAILQMGVELGYGRDAKRFLDIVRVFGKAQTQEFVAKRKTQQIGAATEAVRAAKKKADTRQ
jgi:hypothetical protein